MANYTTYKNLEKPDASELYNINVANKNNDIIDSELHKLELKYQSQNELFAAKEALQAETERATAKEHEISAALASEISRAKSSENTNADSIAAEAERATAAEDHMSSILQNHTSDHTNPHHVTRELLGLGNVDNTSDMDKPVSAAQQEAIDTALSQSNQYTDTHAGNNVIHVTQNDKDNWSDANQKKHIHDNQTVLDDITSALVTEWNHSVDHISDPAKHITSEERTAWNAANVHAISSHAPVNAERNIIAGIQKNGIDLPVSEDRKVNLDFPTNLSSFDNDIGYISENQAEELLSHYSDKEEMQLLIEQAVSQIPEGEDGLSAYEIALSHGFSGTEKEWIESLNGNDGADGFSPMITENTANSSEVYKLDITTKNGSFTTPNLRSIDNSENPSEKTGLFAFEIRDDGHLWVILDSETPADNFHIDGNGHLIYTLEG